MPPLRKSPHEYRVFRISPTDTNRLAIIFDPPGEGTPFSACVEIFDVGGQTPPNAHVRAHEMFDVDRRPAEIVTVYRTTKLAKYWRDEP